MQAQEAITVLTRIFEEGEVSGGANGSESEDNGASWTRSAINFTLLSDLQQV
jgi:hypothetical protein